MKMVKLNRKALDDKSFATNLKIQTLETAILGQTHLNVAGKLVPLMKCPVCNSLRNIHVDVMENHIRLTHPEKTYNEAEIYPEHIRSLCKELYGYRLQG